MKGFTTMTDRGQQQLYRNIIELHKKGISNAEIAVSLKCSPAIIRKTINGLNDDFEPTEKETLTKSIHLEKQNQRLRDQQRIERKIREEFRYDNSLTALTQELIDIFKKRPAHSLIKHKINKNEFCGIIHITDTHFNELINITGNQYDFTVASKRLQKLVGESVRIFSAYGVKKILIAFTGDLMNSDRRLDELLNMATNRAKATALSAIILEQMIVDLNQHFDISIASVSGNEGRVKDEYGISEIMISDNYDYTINEILKLMFRRNPEIKFVSGATAELVVDLQGKNILLMHGQQIKGELTKSVQSIRGKYSDKQTKIDFMIFGHLHSANITDFYARSSSLCGSNAYSDNELQYSSKASQNIQIIGKSDIHSFKIDLQSIENIKGYAIEKDLEEYDARAFSKISYNKPKKI